jgi:predicted hydrolase (HD superfamily)
VITVNSDDSAESSQARGGLSDDEPLLVFDQEEEDFDPELDQDALERVELTAQEVLEGEFASQEMQRGVSCHCERTYEFNRVGKSTD